MERGYFGRFLSILLEIYIFDVNSASSYE